MTILIAITSHLLAVISPGPDTAIVLKTALNKGKNEVRLVAYGIGVGIFFHCLFATIGLELIEKLIPNFLFYISIIGGIYFIYIGISSFLDAGETHSTESIRGSYFNTGLLVNLLNTKALMFFIALFAYLKNQVDQLLFFIMYFPIATCGWFLLLGFIITSIKGDINFLSSNILNYIFSLFFVCAGIFILLTS